MLIVTVDDQDFPALQEALENARQIGSYTQNGKVQIVRANNRLVMVTREGLPDKIAIKPARNISEAEDIALRLLAREQERGGTVEFTPAKEN